ncbi:hypothetical protein ACFUPX_15650, partial [Streptomyces sp. NPDC057302]
AAPSAWPRCSSPASSSRPTSSSTPVCPPDGHRVVEAPLPVRGYRSTLHVQPVADTGGAFLSWHATFDPAPGTTAQEATAVLEAAYAPAIAGLHTIIA